MRIPGNPAAQAVVDRIETIRAARADSMARIHQIEPGAVSALVALVDKLNDPSATAIVLRRPNQSPNDLILLTEQTASVATLGSAMQALARERDRSGLVPTRLLEIVVRGGSVPKGWHRSGAEIMVADQLVELSRASKRNIPGVGNARAVRVVIQSAKKAP